MILNNVTIKLSDGFWEFSKHLGEECYWVVRQDSHEHWPWSVYYIPQYGGDEGIVDSFTNMQEALEKADWIAKNWT